jgi:hypothetical protein
MNWSRIFSYRLLAAIIWVILGVVATALLGRSFSALPNSRIGAPTPGFVLLNIVIDPFEHISILWLYAAAMVSVRELRSSRLSLVVHRQLRRCHIVFLRFLSPSTVVSLIIGTFPALALATLIEAKFYRE